MPQKTLIFNCYTDDWGKRPFVIGREKEKERVFVAVLPGEPIPICGFDALFHK